MRLLLSSMLFLLAFVSFLSGTVFAGENDKESEEKRISVEFELDAYYSNIGLYIPLTEEPIPNVGEKDELEIYKDFLLSPGIPRFAVLEASVNPMPCLGVFIKRNEPDFYEDAKISENFNLIQALTAGFEEPYAFSLFLGDVVSFTKSDQPCLTANKGYVGYLLSAGNYHIKDNETISDDWYELEWKVKGDRDNPKQSLHWSFRIGGKFHSNSEIADVIYISLRRSRVDFEYSAFSIFQNTGFEYTYQTDSRTLSSVQHTFFVSKKWPWKKFKAAFALDLGFISESSRKYSGSLREDEDGDEFTVILRPNIEF